jgi:hypothetical protein
MSDIDLKNSFNSIAKRYLNDSEDEADEINPIKLDINPPKVKFIKNPEPIVYEQIEEVQPESTQDVDQEESIIEFSEDEQESEEHSGEDEQESEEHSEEEEEESEEHSKEEEIEEQSEEDIREETVQEYVKYERMFNQFLSQLNDRMFVLTEEDLEKLSDNISQKIVHQLTAQSNNMQTSVTQPVLQSAKQQLQSESGSIHKEDSKLKLKQVVDSNVLTDSSNKLSNLLDTYKAKSPEEFTCNFGELFSQVFIINLNNKGEELKSRLSQLGIKSKVIKTRIARRTSGIFDFLSDVVREARNRNLDSIMVLMDTGHISNTLIEEIAEQAANITEKDWKLLYLGGSNNLIRNDKFDWKFYAETYPELTKHGINAEPLYVRHWKFYGQKEGRFGSRLMEQPRLIKNISAIAVHKSGYDEIAKFKKASQLVGSLTKHIKQKSYAVSPLWFLSDPGRVNKARNKHNLHLYGI